MLKNLISFKKLIIHDILKIKQLRRRGVRKIYYRYNLFYKWASFCDIRTRTESFMSLFFFNKRNNQLTYTFFQKTLILSLSLGQVRRYLAEDLPTKHYKYKLAYYNIFANFLHGVQYHDISIFFRDFNKDIFLILDKFVVFSSRFITFLKVKSYVPLKRKKKKSIKKKISKKILIKV